VSFCAWFWVTSCFENRGMLTCSYNVIRIGRFFSMSETVKILLSKARWNPTTLLEAFVDVYICQHISKRSSVAINLWKYGSRKQCKNVTTYWKTVCYKKCIIKQSVNVTIFLNNLNFNRLYRFISKFYVFDEHLLRSSNDVLYIGVGLNNVKTRLHSVHL